MKGLERMYYPGQFTRIFHHYENLEEYHAGMWRIVRGNERKRFVEAASDLMRQCDDFKEAMTQAIDAWPISCEHNLTAEGVNKIAWLGHAGCCIATGSPEDCTRVGWHTLTNEEQYSANHAAGSVLMEWCNRHSANSATLFDHAGLPC